MAAQKRRKQRGKQANQPVLSKKALWVAVGFAVLGMALSLYATRLTFKIDAQGIVEASGCSLNDLINCDIASASSYAKMLGIPVAWWGFLFYVFAGLSALFGATAQRTEGSAPFVAGAMVLSILSVLFTFVKAWHLYSLGVICIVCVGMYIANFGLAISLGSALGYGPARWGAFIGDYMASVRGRASGLGFSTAPGKVGIAVLAVFGIGYAGAVNHQKDIAGGISPQQLQRALDQHFSQPPNDVQVDPEAPVWGNPDADIKIVEFADFQCPACQQSAMHLRPALFEFREDVSFTFMNYPLQMHPMGETSARAGVCAAQFGDFWDYHDDIFANQAILSNSLLIGFAEDRGWDTREFAQCMVSDATTERIDSDIEKGRTALVSATPSLYINGRKVSLWSNTQFIQEIIKREMAGSN